MSGRFNSIIAILALTTHLWVSMVVAPWHRLVEHRLTTAEPAEKSTATAEIKAARGCRCHRHSAPVQAAAGCRDNKGAPGDAQQSTPAIPDHDDCEVCQVLAQHFTAPDLPAPELRRERVDSRLPMAPVQPLLGCLLDPVSRGPPAA